MKKVISGLLIAMLLISNTAYGKPSGSSSSSSRPSGGSSGGKSYSSSSSKPSGGSSYSGSSGKSYSSSPSTPKPSGTTPSSSSKPSTPSVPGSSGKSYTSGSSSKPSTPQVSPPVKPSVSEAPKVAGSNGKSYTSGNKQYTPVSSSPSGSSKPKGGNFDGNAAEAKKREESKANYIKGAEAKSSYTTPTGKSVNIDNSSKSVTSIRTMSHTTYVTRETRIVSTFGGYYGRPLVIYNDPFPSVFWNYRRNTSCYYLL